MVATLLERRTRADEPAREIADVFDDDHLVRIAGLPPDRGEERRRRVEALLTRVDGNTAPLEELRSRYQRRLHRASDDLEATEGLRTVEAALSRIPRHEGLWAWQRRERGAAPQVVEPPVILQPHRARRSLVFCRCWRRGSGPPPGGITCGK